MVYAFLAVAVIVLFFFTNLILKFNRRPKTTLIYGYIYLNKKNSYENIKVFVGKMNRVKDKIEVIPYISSRGELLETTTDEKGYYELKDVPMGDQWLVARYPGYRTYMLPISVDLSPRCPIRDLTMMD